MSSTNDMVLCYLEPIETCNKKTNLRKGLIFYVKKKTSLKIMWMQIIFNFLKKRSTIF